MFKLFNKKYLTALLALLSITTTSSLAAAECCDSSQCNRLYIGGFGGGIYSNSTKLLQMGTAFFLEIEGGPLAVHAQGNSNKTSSGFGGAQIGYEWLSCPLYTGCSGWNLTPAAEVEAFFYSQTKKGDLINPTDRLPEHDFLNSFPMDVGVYLANGVVTLNHSSLGRFAPYVGGGIGVASLSIRNANSSQVDPVEEGINHFNSKTNDSSWAFAAQAKAGIRYMVCEWLHIFAEYRFLFVDSSNYIFGSTTYPDHAATSPWNVEVQNMYYNAFTLGIQFDL